MELEVHGGLISAHLHRMNSMIANVVYWPARVTD